MFAVETAPAFTHRPARRSRRISVNRRRRPAFTPTPAPVSATHTETTDLETRTFGLSPVTVAVTISAANPPYGIICANNSVNYRDDNGKGVEIIPAILIVGGVAIILCKIYKAIQQKDETDKIDNNDLIGVMKHVAKKGTVDHMRDHCSPDPTFGLGDDQGAIGGLIVDSAWNAFWNKAFAPINRAFQPYEQTPEQQNPNDGFDQPLHSIPENIKNK